MAHEVMVLFFLFFSTELRGNQVACRQVDNVMVNAISVRGPAQVGDLVQLPGSTKLGRVQSITEEEGKLEALVGTIDGPAYFDPTQLSRAVPRLYTTNHGDNIQIRELFSQGDSRTVEFTGARQDDTISYYDYQIHTEYLDDETKKVVHIAAVNKIEDGNQLLPLTNSPTIQRNSLPKARRHLYNDSIPTGPKIKVKDLKRGAGLHKRVEVKLPDGTKKNATLKQLGWKRIAVRDEENGVFLNFLLDETEPLEDALNLLRAGKEPRGVVAMEKTILRDPKDIDAGGAFFEKAPNGLYEQYASKMGRFRSVVKHFSLGDCATCHRNDKFTTVVPLQQMSEDDEYNDFFIKSLGDLGHPLTK